jgi:hypothetical protein
MKKAGKGERNNDEEKDAAMEGVQVQTRLCTE